jgi:hypothetical protein
MKQHYFVVRWDEENLWQIDHDVAGAVMDGTLYDTDEERWEVCLKSEDEKRDEMLAIQLEALLRGGKGKA